MAEDIFTGETPNLPQSVDDLVGEGKKYADVNKLAEAYGHADKRIKELSDLLEQRAQEAQIQRDIEEARAKAPKPDDSTPPVIVPPKPDAADFRTQIRNEVTALQAETRRESNLRTAIEAMQEHYGDETKAAEAVARRASELGVSKEWLRDSASTSPAAFFATMGITQARSNSTPSIRSEYRPGTEDKTKRFSYYNEIRKTDKKAYNSVEIQTEMRKAAEEMGESFFDT